MIRPITVGMDGSPESLAAADWAAREAGRRDLPLRLVQSWPAYHHDAPSLKDPARLRHFELRILREARETLQARHPALPIDTAQLHAPAAEMLLSESARAALLVLGSRGQGPLAGFLLGSVSHQVLAHAHGPVAMVRATERSAAEHDGDGVVVGLSRLDTSVAALLDLAFAQAAARHSSLRAVHAPSLPPRDRYDLPEGPEDTVTARTRKELLELLVPWREAHPDVPVTATVELAHATGVLLRAAEPAGLVVVGRRLHRHPLAPSPGAVAHAVLHHASAPVVVVPYA
ncbi:universal stress protein [Streptomyces beihaiensis]|uniref:Universal stress protein n=1 Tax=Streptomyces beihaiensis TaxID=2984495 RepID=A0ABT3TV31_9ACTN|nr:universal stress protein [Streptomyces beihaiensis]MCX3060869.1 universal stress protein [Streptomyces beihaiensis]